jgi:hypothetical protein
MTLFADIGAREEQGVVNLCGGVRRGREESGFAAGPRTKAQCLKGRKPDGDEEPASWKSEADIPWVAHPAQTKSHAVF